MLVADGDMIVAFAANAVGEPDRLVAHGAGRFELPTRIRIGPVWRPLIRFRFRLHIGHLARNAMKADFDPIRSWTALACCVAALSSAQAAMTLPRQVLFSRSYPVARMRSPARRWPSTTAVASLTLSVPLPRASLAD